MNLLRGLALVLAFAAATMLVFGSVGFTSVAADRGVAVSVVEDDSAYVGMSVCDVPKNESDGHPVEVSIQNLFGVELTINEIEGRLAKGKEPPEVVNPGHEEEFTTLVANSTDEVTLHANTTSATVEVTREIRGKNASVCDSNGNSSGNTSASS